MTQPSTSFLFIISTLCLMVEHDSPLHLELHQPNSSPKPNHFLFLSLFSFFIFFFLRPMAIWSSSYSAIQCSSYSTIVPGGQTKKTMGRAVYKSQMQPTKVSACLIKPSLTIKIFEDKAEGIVCYRDDKGEIVCEGYDEGPRFIRHPSDKTYQQRCSELQIPEFLTQRWLQILEDQS